MKRTKVASTDLREVGHEGTTLEVSFHAKTCQKRQSAALACNCTGGSVYQYPDVTSREAIALLGAPSIGKHFSANFRKRPAIKILPTEAVVTE